jgi:PAS domain S-box-containing protein
MAIDRAKREERKPDEDAVSGDPELLAALYRHLFENLHDAAMLADATTGLVVDANHAAEALTGRSRSELIGLHQSALHPAGEADYSARFNARVASGESGPVPAELLCADGTVIPVTVSASVFRFGERRFVLGLFRDLREARRTEQAMRTEAAFRTAIENSVLAGVTAVDGDGRITYVSPAFCRMVDFNREELLGKLPPHPYWPPELRVGLGEMMRKRLAGQSGVRGLELKLLRKDGSRIDCYMQVSELQVGGERLGWLAAFQDISVAKQYQEAFAHAVAASRDGFWLVHAPTGRILDVNAAYCQVSGFARDELIGKTLFEVDANETPESYGTRLEEIRRTGGRTFAVRHRSKHGSLLELEVSVASDRGRELIYAFFRDITGRPRARAALRETERRSQASDTTEQDAASV